MKQDRQVMLFEAWVQTESFNSIFESVSGEIKNIDKAVGEILKDMKKEGADDDDAKAAILMQAMELADSGKDVKEIDIDKAKEDVKEGLTIKGKSLDDISESESGIIHAIEAVSLVLGNAALLEFIAKKVQKLTGKKMNPSEMKNKIDGLMGAIKKVSGLPAKAIAKFFTWIAEKFGFDAKGQKLAELIGMGLVVAFMFVLGAVHFPLAGGSIVGIIISITAMIGKTTELVHIGSELIKLAKEALAGKDKAEETLGVSKEELEKLQSA